MRQCPLTPENRLRHQGKNTALTLTGSMDVSEPGRQSGSCFILMVPHRWPLDVEAGDQVSGV